MRCEYCSKKQGNKPAYENYDDKAEIIRYINEETYTLAVNERIGISINFCPLCGRKLHKEIEEVE